MACVIRSGHVKGWDAGAIRTRSGITGDAYLPKAEVADGSTSSATT